MTSIRSTIGTIALIALAATASAGPKSNPAKDALRTITHRQVVDFGAHCSVEPVCANVRVDVINGVATITAAVVSFPSGQVLFGPINAAPLDLRDLHFSLDFARLITPDGISLTWHVNGVTRDDIASDVRHTENGQTVRTLFQETKVSASVVGAIGSFTITSPNASLTQDTTTVITP